MKVLCCSSSSLILTILFLLSSAQGSPLRPAGVNNNKNLPSSGGGAENDPHHHAAVRATNAPPQTMSPLWKFPVGSSFTNPRPGHDDDNNPDVGGSRTIGGMALTSSGRSTLIATMLTNETIAAWEVPSGRLRWSTHIPGWTTPSQNASQRGQWGYAQFKPAISEEENVVVIANGLPCEVVALDLTTGDIVWQHSIQDCADSGLQVNLNPLVYPRRKTVIISVGNADQNRAQSTPTIKAYLISYELKTGNITWTSGNETGFNSPTGLQDLLLQDDVIYTYHGHLFYHLIAIDPATGEEITRGSSYVIISSDEYLSQAHDMCYEQNLATGEDYVYILTHEIGRRPWRGSFQSGLILKIPVTNLNITHPTGYDHSWDVYTGSSHNNGGIRPRIHLDNRRGGIFFQMQEQPPAAGDYAVSLTVTKFTPNSTRYNVLSNLNSFTYGDSANGPNYHCLPNMAKNGEVIVASRIEAAVFNPTSEIFAFNAETGEKLWTSPFVSSASIVPSSVVVDSLNGLFIVPVTFDGSFIEIAAFPI